MINNDSINLLFKTLEFYDDQYDKVAQMCFDDVKQALLEIVENNLPKETEVLPFGSYFLKSNYQVVEPMEFYVVLHGDKDKIERKELQQKEQNLKQLKKRSHNSSVKSVYQNILGGSSNEEKVLMAFDVAKIIMEKMQHYISSEDVVYFKDNVVFIKFSSNEDIRVLATITIVYDFEKNNNFRFKKYGISTIENSKLIIENILNKNQQTNGNYIVLCKLIKMLELELIITNMSNKYLSKKSLFIESILYNVPNEFYKTDDFCIMLLNITNYLKNINYQMIVLPDNITKMFPKHGYYAKDEYRSFIKKIVYLNNNTNEMLDEVIKQANLNEQNLDEQKPKITKKLGKR